MASTYSDLKIELIGTGEQTGTWGSTTNNNFSVAIGEAITGSADVAFSSADVTVTLTDTNAAQAARNLRLNLTGTSGGARQLILGSGCQIEKLYLINNGLADAVTVKNTSGTGIAVPAGKTMFVYNNGTNVVDAVTHLTSLTTGTLSASGATTFTAGTASTSTTTGTAVITGGLGVSGRINAANFDGIVGANTAAAGNFTTLGATGVATFSAGSVSAPAITTTGDTNTGIFFPAADTIAFTKGGVEAMRISSNGDLGIGTSSPATRLNIADSGGGVALQFNGYTGGQNIQAKIECERPNFNNFESQLRFYTHNGSSLAEKMRITESGDVLVGTTSANGKITVNQTDTGARTISASSPASYSATMFRSDSVTAAGTGWYHLYGSSSTSTVNNIFIYGNGNIENANNSYGAISDIKVKENIVDATPKLDKLMQVKVRNYNLKGEYEQHKQIGVIAQELEQIFPSMIEETQDRGENDELLETTTKSVKYSVFVPMLIKAMQEQQALIQNLTTRLNALEGK
jgi:hypothetical protein